jgi:hypothetical protein
MGAYLRRATRSFGNPYVNPLLRQLLRPRGLLQLLAYYVPPDWNFYSSRTLWP